MKYKEKFYLNRTGGIYNLGTEAHGIRFRYDPVPGVKNYGNCNFYRKMRTTQERRWSLAHKKYTRGKRRYWSLTNSWDDIPRTDYRDRSWKSCTKRKRQYK